MYWTWLARPAAQNVFILVLERLGVGLTDLVKCYRTFVRPQL